MRYIETFKDGDRISEVYLCKSKSSALTKAGKEYENVILIDKTGQIDSKIWDVNSGGICDFEVNDYVFVNGQVTSYNGALQFKIERIRVAAEDEYTPTDYIPSSRYDIEQMYEELLGFVRSVDNPYIKQLLEAFFVEDEAFIKKFKNTSAAKTVHIVIGYEMVIEKIRHIPDFPEILANEVGHCILSHHGELEYGSPKKPAIAEAIALSMADNMDAKLETLRECLEAKDTNDWLGFNRWLESNIRRTSC